MQTESLLKNGNQIDSKIGAFIKIDIKTKGKKANLMKTDSIVEIFEKRSF